jgi:hypothetical protein
MEITLSSNNALLDNLSRKDYQYFENTADVNINIAL